MKRNGRVAGILSSFFNFFLLAALVVTGSILTFSFQMKLDPALLRRNAPITLAIVVGFSLLGAVIDQLRRERTVERPVQQIHRASERVRAGDFSVRLPRINFYEGDPLDAVIDDFNEMVAELAGVETLRTDFIANVSHELKTPLAVIQNYATLLQAPDLPEAQRLEYAQAIRDSSRRLSGLITNILKLNKLENQKIFPEGAEYDLGEQLCECLLGFEDLLEQKELELETDLQDGVFVKADAELLSLVWNNLLSNAVKFTPPRGRITVRLYAQEKKAVVSVQDTGCGISPACGRHIFEKFYQGDPSHAAQGNGLGLALVRRVMDIVGGEIAVESEPGRGSVFRVTLARAAGGRRLPQEKRSEEPAAPLPEGDRP